MDVLVPEFQEFTTTGPRGTNIVVRQKASERTPLQQKVHLLREALREFAPLPEETKNRLVNEVSSMEQLISLQPRVLATALYFLEQIDPQTNVPFTHEQFTNPAYAQFLQKIVEDMALPKKELMDKRVPIDIEVMRKQIYADLFRYVCIVEGFRARQV